MTALFRMDAVTVWGPLLCLCAAGTLEHCAAPPPDSSRRQIRRGPSGSSLDDSYGAGSSSRLIGASGGRVKSESPRGAALAAHLRQSAPRDATREETAWLNSIANLVATKTSTIDFDEQLRERGDLQPVLDACAGGRWYDAWGGLAAAALNEGQRALSYGMFEPSVAGRIPEPRRGPLTAGSPQMPRMSQQVSRALVDAVTGAGASTFEAPTDPKLQEVVGLVWYFAKHLPAEACNAYLAETVDSAEDSGSAAAAAEEDQQDSAIRFWRQAVRTFQERRRSPFFQDAGVGHLKDFAVEKCKVPRGEL